MLLAALSSGALAADAESPRVRERLAASAESVTLASDGASATVLVRLESHYERPLLVSLNSAAPVALVDAEGRRWELADHPGLLALDYSSNAWARPQTRLEPRVPVVTAFRFNLPEGAPAAERSRSYAFVASLVAADVDVDGLSRRDRWLLPLSAHLSSEVKGGSE